MNEDSGSDLPQESAALCRTISPLADKFFFPYFISEQVFEREPMTVNRSDAVPGILDGYPVRFDLRRQA